MMESYNKKHKPGRILIIDDDEYIRHAFTALFQGQDYIIECAEDGAQGFQKVAEFGPDVILLDVMMPGMDGFEVCQKLKADASWRHIPIILVTALDTKEDLARGLESGADEFLSKPVESLELRARVRSMLRIKRQYDELEALIKLRDDLENMIVHDMRSPLTIILGSSENLLESTEIPEEEKRWAEKIYTQSKRLNRQMTDMLLLAKMESGQLTLDSGPVDVRELIQSVLTDMENIAQARHIRLRIDIPEQPCIASLDSSLFVRVIDNLISNALKYSGTDTEVSLCLRNVENGSGVSLEVTDQGPGIPEEYRDKVFDKFEIVALKYQGVMQIGLGLAFCKLVVDAHGGQISVRDNYPRGAVFSVFIK